MGLEQPISQNNNQRQVAVGFSIPPSVGGLNARDALADMDPKDAYQLDNLIPRPNYVELRRGFSEWATGMGAFPINSLMEWAGPASRKEKAAVNGSVYDVTAMGAVGAAELTGLASTKMQWVNFKTAGGSFLIWVNGSDAPQNYNGTAWSTSPAITGVTPANLINIAVHKSRLWFVEKDTTNAWYLPVSVIGGAATKQDLGQQFKLGGKLIAIGTLSFDAGDGADDFLAFISSRGEVAIYQGTDPTSATTWALKGVYNVGFPIGNRPVMRVAGDLGIICGDGIVSTIQMTNLDRASAAKASISDKIQPLFNAAVRDYSSNFGWQGIVYPRGTIAIFNIPQSETIYFQYVMNTLTGAWCKFKNINAVCWGLLGDDLYFGGTNGIVYKADSGYFDDEGPITGLGKTAWNYFKAPGYNKEFTLIRPIVKTDGAPSVLLTMNVDFVDSDPIGAIDIGTMTDNLWGTGLWDVALWSGDGTITALWNTPGAIGYCASVAYQVTSQGQSFQSNSFDGQYIPGGPL